MGERSPTGKASGHSPPATETRSELPLPFESWTPDDRDETVRVSALDEQDLASPDPHIALTLHKRIARKFLEDGDTHRAFGELMRAAQTVEIDAELAHELSRLARRSGFEVAAAAALDIAAPRAISEHRNEVRRCAARLFRRLGRFPQARAILNAGLEEEPDDRRTRRLLCLVALHEGNYELAAEELERETDDDERRGRHRQAARSALALARLLQEQLFDPEGAARAYARAAESAQNARDLSASFSARVLAVRALAASKASAESLDAALAALTAAGRDAKREAEAAAIAAELGRSPLPEPASSPAQLAEAALASGNYQEAEAQLRKAVEADPTDAALADRLESYFIGRGSWTDLAAHYRARASREASAQARADVLHKLAELLEDELSDKAGAAEVYASIVEETGDPAALAAQVRLLSASSDPKAAQAALDGAVENARSPEAKAEALLLRGETHLAARKTEEARADFEDACTITPSLRAIAGLAECRTDRATIERFDQAFKELGRGVPGRVALARRLARLLEWPLGEGERASEVWREVLAESPADAEAEARLIDLARAAGKAEELIDLLRRRLAREPRGPQARAARHELASLLETTGRDEEAFNEWHIATRMEPGDAVALIALAQRCEKRGKLSEAAFCLEGAAAATEPGPERAALWLRLAKLAREGLNDPSRAAICEERARSLLEKQAKTEKAKEEAQAARTIELPSVTVAGPVAVNPPAPEIVAPLPSTAVEPPPENDQTPTTAAAPAVETQAASTSPAPSFSEDDIVTADVLETVDEAGKPAAPRTAEAAEGEQAKAPASAPAKPGLLGSIFSTLSGARPSPAPAGDEGTAAPQEAEQAAPEEPEKQAPIKRKPRPRRTTEQRRLQSRISEEPLDPEGYHALASLFEKAGDTARATLMEEIANALAGDPFAEPLPPRFTLEQSDWAALRHRGLRASVTELFGLVGPAMCAVSAVSRKEAGIRRPFSMDEGKGSRAAAEALLCAVRILGVRAPDVQLGNLETPPFWSVNTNPATLLVGKIAVSRVLPAAQLRFFAGRALASFSPELIALRFLSFEQLEGCLENLKQAVLADRPLSLSARALARRIPARSSERLAFLLETFERRGIDLSTLTDAARYTANRAGLIVAGGVAPAVTALRAKRGATDELIEVVRYAVSPKYLELRSKR